MTTETPSLYDRDRYYADNRRGSRLTPMLDWLLDLLEWERVFPVVSRVKGRLGTILDVGAGDGKFLRLLRRRGFAIAGTTASQRSAEGARDAFGIELAVTEGLDEVAVRGPFQAITYWHVFEHLTQPETHVRRWRDLLENDGLLVVEVPNIDSLGAKLCYASWLGSDPVHHVNHVAPEALVQTIRAGGLKIERVSHASLKFTYVFLWSAWLGRLFPGPYGFDAIMDLLRRPAAAVRAKPLVALNAIASVAYLAPLVLLSAVYGIAVSRGEVIRVYARR